MSCPDKKISAEPVFRGLVWSALMLDVLLNFIPGTAAASTLADNLEDSWTQALHVAFVQHLQFGTDFVFTYGPWGFLARGYQPDTYVISVISWTVFSVVYLWAGWRLARHFSSHWPAAAVWLAAFTLAASVPAVEGFNTRLMGWCVLLLFIHFFVDEKASSPLVLVLAGLLGWLGLVKFTGFMTGAGLMGVIAADNVIRQRRFPRVALAWLAGILIFWLAAGQHPGLLPAFLLNSWRVTSGYTEAMMSVDSGAQQLRAVTYVLLSLGLCALAGFIAWPRFRWLAFLPVAGVALILFLNFKTGYVRNDWLHEPSAVMVLMFCALGGLAVARTAEKALARAAVILLVLTTAFSGMVVRGYFFPEHLDLFMSPTSPGRLFKLVTHPRENYLQDQFDLARGQNRSRLSLPPGGGGTDLYAYDQDLLFAQAVPYQPRPVFQSYSAYTRGLAEMNAAHLRSARAATNLIFSVRTIDQRYPPMDDGMSWPELLTLYDLKGAVDSEGMYLLLTRAATPREYHKTLLSTLTAGFGDAIPVPSASNGPVWVEMELHKTPIGKLATALYKPAGLAMQLTPGDQNPHVFRFLPGEAEGGFLLSPMVTDARGFAGLASGDYRQAGGKLDVQSMLISANTDSGETICYESRITLRFYRLEFPWQPSKN